MELSELSRKNCHFFDIFGFANAKEGLSKPDAVVYVLPCDAIVDGKMTMTFKAGVEKVDGELADGVSAEDIVKGVTGYATACKDELLSMYAYAKSSGHTLSRASALVDKSNAYLESNCKMVPGRHYALVSVVSEDMGKRKMVLFPRKAAREYLVEDDGAAHLAAGYAPRSVEL